MKKVLHSEGNKLRLKSTTATVIILEKSFEQWISDPWDVRDRYLATNIKVEAGIAQIMLHIEQQKVIEVNNTHVSIEQEVSIFLNIRRTQCQRN